MKSFITTESKTVHYYTNFYKMKFIKIYRYVINHGVLCWVLASDLYFASEFYGGTLVISWHCLGVSET